METSHRGLLESGYVASSSRSSHLSIFRRRSGPGLLELQELLAHQPHQGLAPPRHLWLRPVVLADLWVRPWRHQLPVRPRSPAAPPHPSLVAARPSPPPRPLGRWGRRRHRGEGHGSVHRVTNASSAQSTLGTSSTWGTLGTETSHWSTTGTRSTQSSHGSSSTWGAST